MEANNVQSSASSGNVHSKTDPAWEHFTLSTNDKGAKVYYCLYCGKNYQGGGIYRMKEHLVGKSGNILPCGKVPPDVRACIKEYITKSTSSKSKEKELVKEAYEEEVEEVDEQELNPTMKFGKRKAKGSLENFITSKPTPLSHPGIKSAMASKQAIHKANMTFSRWCFDACISFNAMRSPYFQPMLDAIGSIGAGYKAPSYNDMRINLLRGISFVKSVDASDILKDATNLFNLFMEIIEWVGPDNVVHLVTDNASNYVVAGRLIHEKYDHIYWSPCAAHCLNLILKDIGKRDHVAKLVSRVSKVTIFVYNHIYILSWLRKRSGWKEIVRPGATRFVTTFITLKSIYDHKHDLQALVTDKYYTSHKLSKSPASKTITSIILDAKFWEECLFMVKIVAPIIRLLRVVDADEKPSLGYVYEGMIRIRKAIMSIFRNKSTMHQYKKRSYDPVDYDCIDKMDFWIVEEEEEAELVDGDMVEAIYGEDAIPTLDESHNQDDVDMNEEEVDFELFGHASYDDAFDQQKYLGQRDDNESWPQHQP
ncbi:uncharacterized protein LOC120265020 [Dioscorea cayenensis subsp. rotundata]|uniref:Uncharacterized protein LOC120265020 n=1 Tax=Dioscorea cayennensis subsp. rotundata TaxID=55577 RepID=A0AB40BNC2_DIOCR|nr:uncharacterized protein LOC120265020 [Dioscorea cayenensis subsp. rotundata]